MQVDENQLLEELNAAYVKLRECALIARFLDNQAVLKTIYEALKDVSIALIEMEVANGKSNSDLRTTSVR